MTYGVGVSRHRPVPRRGGAHSRCWLSPLALRKWGCLPPSDSPSGSSSRFSTHHPPRRRHDLLDLLPRDVRQQLQHGGVVGSTWLSSIASGLALARSAAARGSRQARRTRGGTAAGPQRGARRPRRPSGAEVRLHFGSDRLNRTRQGTASAPGRVPCPSAAARGQRRPRVAPRGGSRSTRRGRQSAGRPASRRPSSPAVVRTCPRPIRG